MILKQNIKVIFLINSNYFISALINKVSPPIIFSNLKFILRYYSINVCENITYGFGSVSKVNARYEFLHTDLDLYVK